VARRIRQLTVVAIGVAGMAAAAGAAQPPVGADGFAPAYYSNSATVTQARSPEGMRWYLSTDQRQMEMQSYVFFGNLMTRSGRPTSFASMVQRQDGLLPQVPGLPVTLSTLMFNSGQGIFGGVIDGIPEVAAQVGTGVAYYPLTLTSNPWSARSEEFTPGQQPEFIDFRVVEGQLGRRGSLYEITARITSENMAGGAKGEPMIAYVRVRDMTGIVMWGFGPSGFKPQWITPAQRSAIMGRYGGSIARYLRASNDPMTNQGNYYYSSPLLKVEKFTVFRNAKLVLSGSGGYTFFDLCAQTFDQNAKQVLHDRFGWVSFEMSIPGLNGGMALGHLTRPGNPDLPYAALATTASPRARNGALVARNWGLKDISLRPVRSSAWVSPTSGLTYYMTWSATLRGPDAASRGRLTLTAVNRNSEVNFGGRSVYEGLFRYSGVLAGKKVSGTAFTEMQGDKGLGVG